MSDFPEPLVSLEIDLRDFPFMPLDVVRLRDSELSATVSAEEFRAAVLLWCASWHQLPAGSLPDDDVQLSQLSGFGRVVKEWKKHRRGALHGWVKCNDGRLYHSVIAEKANGAWRGKLMQQWRTECSRIRKQNERSGEGGEKVPSPTFDEWLSQRHGVTVTCDNESMSHATTTKCHANVERETASNREGEGQGQGQGQGELNNNLPAYLPIAEGGGAERAELDLVEKSCRLALGEQAPQTDFVIGPMVEMVRKFGQERVSLTLASEIRRPRRKPIRTWRIWAEIVGEALSENPAQQQNFSGETPYSHRAAIEGAKAILREKAKAVAQ